MKDSHFHTRAAGLVLSIAERVMRAVEAVYGKHGPLYEFQGHHTSICCNHTTAILKLEICSTQVSDGILPACKLQSPNFRVGAE